MRLMSKVPVILLSSRPLPMVFRFDCNETFIYYMQRELACLCTKMCHMYELLIEDGIFAYSHVRKRNEKIK